MKVCFIVPKRYFYLSRRYSDFYLLLAQQIQYEKPLFFKDKYVVLDNGAYELGRAIDSKEFSDIVEYIKPDEIVCPDKRFDGRETCNMTHDYLSRYYSNRYKYMGVIQGKNFSDWEKSAIWMQNNPKITVLGITDIPDDFPRFGYSHFCKLFFNKDSDRVFQRIDAIAYISTCFSSPKPVHILGSIDPIELPCLVRFFPFVCRTDSKIAFWNGVHENILTSNGLSQGSKKFDNMLWNFRSKLSLEKKRIIKNNINVFYNLAKGKFLWEERL